LKWLTSELAGPPVLEFGNKDIAVVKWVDGTVLDTIKQVEN